MGDVLHYFNIKLYMIDTLNCTYLIYIYLILIVLSVAYNETKMIKDYLFVIFQYDPLDLHQKTLNFKLLWYSFSSHELTLN